MSDLSDYPKEHPETGKVKNPLTGNWVKKSYAKKQDLFEQAKQHTQQHFMEEDDSSNESEEIDELLKAAEEVDAGEGFDLSDEELERLDERADINHPELPNSDFPDEEEFADEAGFEQPPTPEGLNQAAKNKKNEGEFQGIYNSKNSRSRSNPSSLNESSQSQKKEEKEEPYYIRTEHGGLKTVYPSDQNEDK